MTYHQMQVYLLLTCFVFFSCSASSVTDFPPTTCSFSGKTYKPGETWHRRLENSGSVFCVACRCKEEGTVNCSSISCSDIDCNNSESINNECCRFCQVRVEPLPTASMQVSCLHNGRVYQDSQTFASNSTGLQTHSPNQCVQCVCQVGQVLCRLKTCPSAQCTHPPDPSDCCPCQADCVSGGITYTHGSSWHPIIGPLGQMNCVICKCKSGRIECGRLSCPHPPSCVRLQPVQGQCCPICIDKVADHEFSVTESENVDTREKVAETFMCLPRPLNTIVYRSHASSSISGYYQYAFQVSATNKNTRLLSWTVKDGFMEKFIRKAKRLPDRCGTRCSTKISRLERILHLKEFLERHQCLENEVKFE